MVFKFIMINFVNVKYVPYHRMQEQKKISKLFSQVRPSYYPSST